MKRVAKSFVVCINNKGYLASLEIRKLYQAIPDETAAKVRQVRVIDESGEDYLYSRSKLAPQVGHLNFGSKSHILQDAS